MSANDTMEILYERAQQEWEKIEKNKVPVIYVGSATCGRAAGALETEQVIKEVLQENSKEAIFIEVGCMGPCAFEPIIMVQPPSGVPICYGPVKPQEAKEFANLVVLEEKNWEEKLLGVMSPDAYKNLPPITAHPMLSRQVRNILRNCGLIDPENFYHYLAQDGYRGFLKALSIGPDNVLEQVKKSGLRGRGGAGFPTWRKWSFCREAPGNEKYLICNADEGDPGAFMNRSVLEGDPHSVLEGMLIAGYTIGANHGYVYCRAEYPLAIHRLEIAIKQLYDYGLLGKNILGTGFSFDITIKKGAGAFVCGEETALIASIEGSRGMPRPRPPFPAISGLWGKPTVIQNVETLANLSLILHRGAEWYIQFGNENSKGTKTFALAGKVKRTGLVEIPLGIQLRDVIFEIGGGILNDKEVKAVQTGGPSGGCIPAEMLDLPVDYESLTKAGSIMGSGGMIVLDEDNCMVDIARYFLSFTQAESCGKCTPCRVGTRAMLGILERICAGKGELIDIIRLETLAQTVKQGSLCGLGQTAPNPVLSTLKYFRHEYEEHIKTKECRAFVCSALISYHVDPERCAGCTMCAKACPVQAISGKRKEPHVIHQEKCIRCGQCLRVCPTIYSAVYRRSGSRVRYEPIKERKKKTE
ncbi:MAG TPA: NADH-quinone oxidoreductase subunit NuoF [Candidatus Hydrogenedens sp.]|mgnify:CR=1 FL=1|nr:NADH-quinone oxidoreductase subunit NuoF [Candidatus Hydrogenedens sp.]HOL19219.1 NADH-quinone oxidoreductase subunit NuoF [Candidatus Hydrogenedens sp.]HPP58434.1 NADH-quinone oxidoreductase subunit NuoF [Candidatus Hydrogenedens sp.]